MKVVGKMRKVSNVGAGKPCYRTTLKCEKCSCTQMKMFAGVQWYVRKYVIPNHKCLGCGISSVNLGERPTEIQCKGKKSYNVKSKNEN
jgi:hypothetical protein